MRLNTIYNIDCLKGMKQYIGDETIDIVVTSPPYNIGINYHSYQDNKSEEQFLNWFMEVCKELFRVLKKDGSFFLNLGGKPSDSLWPLKVAGKCAEVFVLQNTIHWIKSISISKNDAGNYPHIIKDMSVGHFKPINSKRYLNSCHEYIFHFTKHGKVALDKLANGVEYQDQSNIKRWKSAQAIRDRGNTWFIPYETIKESRPHPSTFPIKLPEMCIKLHGISEKGVVLDPFMGIGTTAISCIRNNVNFVGFEIDREYVKIARSHIRQEFQKKNLVKTYKKERGNKMFKLVISGLSAEDLEPLFREIKGTGGFQSFLKKLQNQYSPAEGVLILEEEDVEKMINYSTLYGQGGFQDRISIILQRIQKVNDKLTKLTSLNNK